MATVYTVKKGDTLWGIATNSDLKNKIKGDTTQDKIDTLVKLNDIEDPGKIAIGQKLQLDGAKKAAVGKGEENAAIVKAFGLQSNSDNTLYAAWNWSKKNTENYKVKWEYDTGDKVWFVGNDSTVTVKQSTYSIPSNAKRVRFKVKPISKKKTVDNKETNYWTANWSKVEMYNTSTAPPAKLSTPNVSMSEDNVLTAQLDNIDPREIRALMVQFQIIKNDKSIFNTGTANIGTNSCSYSCTVEPGSLYKVRCRGYVDDKTVGDWSEYSENVSSSPTASLGITKCRPYSEDSVELEWEAVKVATSYEIQYTNDKNLFDVSNVSSETADSNKRIIPNLANGQTYYFRVRAVNADGRTSEWTDIVSVVLGTTPTAPTTWSSTTTAISGEPVKLYWVHNCADGSRATCAQISIRVDDSLLPHVENVVNTIDKDKDTGVYSFDLDTSVYPEGARINWAVCTRGITEDFGPMSTERTINIYAKPKLELSLTDSNAKMMDVVKSFPIYVNGEASPSNTIQKPIGYHLSIISKQFYETVDNIGNDKIVSEGEEIYSSYVDTTDDLLVELSPSNLDLENNMDYTINCVVSMSSGLTAEASFDFTVSWTDDVYPPNAEIGINNDTITASIRPYCGYFPLVYYKVNYKSGVYVLTDEVLEAIDGTLIEDAATTTFEPVYTGTDSSGSILYYTTIQSDEPVLMSNVTLSVYRREFDGTFTELATGIENEHNTYILDPHPALDYARYRIVAINNSTGGVSYYDVPGQPVNEYAAIIQWDEEWKFFETTVEDALEQPPWSGSMLKLPYNIDVSDNRNVDVSLVEYIGRKHPVSYYGTQLGETSSWSMAVPKDDKDTLYLLRRLSIWTGDVYVREPSGSGYWANVSVSFSQTHCELIIPVTLDIKRVEGGK